MDIDEDKVKDVNEKMNIILKNRTKSDEESSDEAMQIDMESQDRKFPSKDDHGDYSKQRNQT